MYNVDQTKIEEILANMTNLLKIAEPLLNKEENKVIADKISMLAIERVLHISIESIVDVGNLLIDGFIMRDPGGYLDIIEILEDEEVLPKQVAEKVKKVVLFRKPLVHDYTQINQKDLIKVLNEEYHTLLNFGNHVKAYLEKEL